MTACPAIHVVAACEVLCMVPEAFAVFICTYVIYTLPKQDGGGGGAQGVGGVKGRGGRFDGVGDLGAHDALHVSRPAILGGDHHTGRVAEAGADLHILHIWVCQGPLPPVDHPFKPLLHHATNKFATNKFATNKLGQQLCVAQKVTRSSFLKLSVHSIAIHYC